MADDCHHPHLTQVVNPEEGGIASQVYVCGACHDLLRVTFSPLTIVVSYGVPPAEDPTQ
jgi:hypothetical protein